MRGAAAILDWLRRAILHARREQEGLTVVEVLVAALFLALITGASATLFANGENTSLATQRQTALLQVADKQIEAIRQQVKTSGFAALGMKVAPLSDPLTSGANLSATNYNTSTTFTDPDHYVGDAGACFRIRSDYTNDSTGSAGIATGVGTYAGCTAGSEPLVVSGAGGIVTHYQTVSVGTETAAVYAYVTDTNVGCNTGLTSGGCYGTGQTPLGDARRVIVAVVPVSATGGRYNVGPNSPQFAATIFTNPTPTNAPNASIGLTLGLTIG